ncbi:TetR/AcrR family transcriptional regulator [Marinobacter zhejiangensis]|uniref:Transcriptional regulator, TetR family n=1 Tax=Marinobacter zhejiangensis TaxID=488535 RepID=A0A1I4RWG8_9GAMM|nr:TetR/AcrR family transcriptional regulator [Marinobacter zhejiangensis]SFM56612.1 transcriptional regulator, TetR family [Marinobacter zhejiangensis]
MTKKIKTKERILTTSLALFNGIGEPNVTTLLISDELDISPGNLYYHFKSKGDIVTVLFDRYEAEIGELLAVPEHVPISLEQISFFLHILFETVSRYRFLYQDLVNVLSRYDSIQSRFRKILNRKRQAFRVICGSLDTQGIARFAPNELNALCEQLTLTTCYWSSFDSLAKLNDRDATDPGRGVYQMLHLLLPYLAAEEREEVVLLSQDYL